MEVKVFSLKAAMAGTGCGAMVSIAGVRTPMVRPPFDGPVLELSFDDVGVPAFVDHKGVRWTGPTEADLEAALGFARMHKSLAVHCLHGRSRSAAVALAVIADRMGDGMEIEAVERLLADAPLAHPNPLLVRFADRLLGRNGRIEAALLDACPRFAVWRKFWIDRESPEERLRREVMVGVEDARNGRFAEGSVDQILESIDREDEADG